MNACFHIPSVKCPNCTQAVTDMKPLVLETTTGSANPPSTPTSTDTKIEEILDEFYWETVNRPVKGIDEYNTDELDVIMTHKQRLLEEATAALKTLLTSEKNKAVEEELEMLEYVDWASQIEQVTNHDDSINDLIDPYITAYIKDRLTQLRKDTK